MGLKKDLLEEMIRKVVEKETLRYFTNGIPIGVSARHVHLSQEHLEVLFGKGAELHPRKELMGGQYAAEECVTLVGTNLRVIENVRILGPVRKSTQVEVSKTDSIRLGIRPPVRESGDTASSAPITLVGPKGALFLEEGCIVAKRHIHMSTNDAVQYGVTDNQIVAVQLGKQRQGILENVQVRVDPTFTLEMHIDTDEANAMDVKCNDMATIIR